MTRIGRKLALVVGAVFALVIGAVPAFMIGAARGIDGGVFGLPRFAWRARLVRQKSAGAIPATTWPKLALRLVPVLGARVAGPVIRNPFRSETDVAAGAARFRSYCANCHGPEGAGGMAADLTLAWDRHHQDESDLFNTIADGQGGMPPFEGSLSETWQLVSFIESIRRAQNPADSPAGKRRISCPSCAGIDVPGERLRRARQEPHSWLMYSGAWDGKRYSELDQIQIDNVAYLRPAWIYQAEPPGQVPNEPDYRFETSPLVVNDVMFITRPPSDVLALDVRSGLPLWTYRHKLPGDLRLCCYRTNRGVAILGDRVFVGTLDAHLVALDIADGAVIWDVRLADHREGYSGTGAPLALPDRIIVGMAGGDLGTRGFLDAYDPETGKRLWRFNTVPGPGEFGNESWSGDSWKIGGAATWLTGTYDPSLDVVYWGVGNPSPVWNGDGRQGDNLFANSLVAIDAGTGQRRWHHQFTPHDTRDWAANQIPILADIDLHGRQRKVVLEANRNGFFYVLDRETGQFLAGTPFARQNWAQGIDENGRPILNGSADPSENGTLIYPGQLGATNWFSPSFNDRTGLFYVQASDFAQIFYKKATPNIPTLGGRVTNRHSDLDWYGVRAIDPRTGSRIWEFELPRQAHAGILSTAGNLVFFGDDEGIFHALDATTGKEEWRSYTGGLISAAPVTYMVGGRQQIAIAAGRSIITYELPPR